MKKKEAKSSKLVPRPAMDKPARGVGRAKDMLPRESHMSARKQPKDPAAWRPEVLDG